MRALVLLAILASCAPPAIWQTAAGRLGASGRHLRLVDHDNLTYTFCRDEHITPFGAARAYDGACITLICDAGGSGCR
ncbi:MAG TPA: hypothetical protein VGG74_18615 [Kofleriaceae bacterium]|jgi:hypothetical protein